jgi:hypothetical protein
MGYPINLVHLSLFFGVMIGGRGRIRVLEMGQAIASQQFLTPASCGDHRCGGAAADKEKGEGRNCDKTDECVLEKLIRSRFLVHEVLCIEDLENMTGLG